jgi:hypothetical protein
VRLLSEERTLSATLGEPYRDYMRRTKRLVPGCGEPRTAQAWAPDGPCYHSRSRFSPVLGRFLCPFARFMGLTGLLNDTTRESAKQRESTSVSEADV